MRWTALFISVAAVCLLAGNVLAQEEASLFIDPAEQSVAVGSEFDVRVMVDDVTAADGLGGYTLVVSYDPDVVHGVAIMDSGFVASTDNAVVCPSTGIDNDEGRLAHFCFTIPVLPLPGPVTTEPELLATVTFEAVGAGTTDLGLDETMLSDPNGNTIRVSPAGGSVTVGAPDGTAADTPAPAEEAGPTGEASLPAAGNGPGQDSNAGLYIGLIVAGIAGIGVLGAFLILRRRRSAA